MASPKLIRVGWETYRADVMPRKAGEVQVRECRRAFYAGAMAMYTVMDKVSDLEEDKAVDILKAIRDELIEFGGNVGKGL